MRSAVRWGAAALLVALFAVPAFGGLSYTKLAEGPLYNATADSSEVMPVSDYDRMWLDFVITPPSGSTADTLAVLFVSAADVLPLSVTASCDTVSGNDASPCDSASYYGPYEPSTVTDSTAVYWQPVVEHWQPTGTGAPTDTTAYNAFIPATNTPGSNEIRVRFPIRPATRPSQPRHRRVELVNNFGAPFRARYAQFHWRMPAINDPALASGKPAVVNVRVILVGETY